MTVSKAPTVAIIGGGLSGICCARACLEHSLSVTLFDRRLSLGGIWSSSVDTPVFENLTTTPACFEIALSDIPPPRVHPLPSLSKHDDLCITSREFGHYFKHVVKQTPLFEQLSRFGVSVERIEAVPGGGYYVHSTSITTTGEDNEYEVGCEFFDFVVVATGSHTTPFMPTASMPGLNDFPGEVYHASAYKCPKQVCGKRVLIVGGSISGCEIAGDIAVTEASQSAKSVTLSSRHMRHLACKQKDGRVYISEMSSRFQRLRQLAGRLYENDGADALQLNEEFYTNEEFGAPPAVQPIFSPGVPNWCPVNYSVLEGGRSGRLKWNIGGISRVHPDGVVEFVDGERAPFDVIVLATGYQLSFPFLDTATDEMIRSKKLPTHFLDLHYNTFHPELPGLAFVGIFIPGTAAMPMYDAQSRWVACAFADKGCMPTEADMFAGVAASRAMRDSAQWQFVTSGFEVLDTFAELGGFKVNLAEYPEWTKALLFGPMVPAQFRLFGIGRREDALAEFERQITAAGFTKGDNIVDDTTLRQLRELVDELGEVTEVKGLREAISYLVQVNSV